MNITTFIRDGIQWSVQGISSDVVPEIFCAVYEKKQGEVVRNGYYKKVLRYRCHQGTFYLKQYTTRNLLEGVKSLFSLSKARREWNSGHRLLNDQLHTAEPVAVGEKRRFGMLKDCYIISKAIPNSTTVREALFTIQRSSAQVPKKSTFLNNLISYVKEMHDHGILHGELHSENILVDADNPAVFYLLDLGRTVFKKSPSLSSRIRELSRLLYSIADTCTNDEMSGLINTYANHLLAPQHGEIFCKAVLKNIYKTRKRFWHSRTRKCLTTNAVFKATARDNYTVNMRNEWDIGTLNALISQHMHSWKERTDMIVKSSAKTGITRIPVAHESIKSVCIKEYRYPSIPKRCFYSFWHSPARRAWVAAHGLIAANFLTPKPIALFEEKGAGILKRSFLIMEDISACLPCNRYVDEMFRNSFDEIASAKKRRFLACFAASFRQLHNSGIYHGDLKANNIMIRESPDRWDFFYLDLDRVRFHNKLTLKKKIKGLSQLNASLPHCITYTDRLRFYQTYAGATDLRDENKRILRSIIQVSVKRKHVWGPRTKNTLI